MYTVRRLSALFQSAGYWILDNSVEYESILDQYVGYDAMVTDVDSNPKKFKLV